MPIETPPPPATIVVSNPFHEKRVAALALAGILLTFLYIASTLARWGGPQLLPRNEQLPPLMLSGRNGQPVPSDQLRGANSVLLFFTLDCVHCNAMIGHLREVRTAMHRRMQFRLISLNTPAEVMERNAELAKDSALLFMDAGLARRMLHIESVPVTLLVDSGGVLLDEMIGERGVIPLQRAIRRAFAAADEE